MFQFLSMKLATVNPEVNIDIERILSKDVSYTLVLNQLLCQFHQTLSDTLTELHLGFTLCIDS